MGRVRCVAHSNFTAAGVRIAAISDSTRHVEEGLELQLHQFTNSPKLKALLSALLRQLDRIEDAIGQLQDGQWFDNAKGAALDSIGRLVGQQRNTMNDDDFRLWMRARIVVNRSRGTPDDIIRVLKTLVGPDTSVELFQHADISFTAFPRDALKYDAHRVLDILLEAKVLGVTAHLQYAIRTPVFTFDNLTPAQAFFSDLIGGGT